MSVRITAELAMMILGLKHIRFSTPDARYIIGSKHKLLPVAKLFNHNVDI